MKIVRISGNDARLNVALLMSAPFALSALLCLLAGPVWAADNEIEELKRAIQALQAENRGLAQRVLWPLVLQFQTWLGLQQFIQQFGILFRPTEQVF